MVRSQFIKNFLIFSGNPLKVIILLILLSITFSASSQTLEDFYRKSTRTNQTAMYILGTWAAGNMVIGGIGMSQTTGATKHFHQMNLMWNTVNMGIAAFGLWSQSPDLNGNFEDILSQHRKMENLYLINSGLDLVYMAAGGYMIHLSRSSVKRADMLEGYGKSVILQGGFLLVFDTTFWLLQRNLRLNLPDNISLNVLHDYPGIQLTMWF
jgi:hypothetical protein